MKLDFFIQSDQINQRLDTIVSGTVSGCSRSKAARLINAGRITVNQVCKKPGYRVKVGDQISGFLPQEESERRILAQNIPLDICLEDEYILVINKKPGMVVHPATGHQSGTLVNALLFHDPKIERTTPELFRSGIVHRLDRETSGLLVVAKTRHSFLFLQKEFKQRRVKKKYLALVYGCPEDSEGIIEFPIGRHPVKRKMMSILDEGGKKAVTDWRIKKKFPSACLMDIGLKTGRTHQIRVHFYALGYPLVGDRVYQYRKYRNQKQVAVRPMLHSYYLSFRHPYSGKRIEVSSEIPDDFLSVMTGFE